MLRELITVAAGDGVVPVPKGVGRGSQIGVRFRGEERVEIDRLARLRRVTPSGWVRMLVLGFISGQPQWGGEEIDELRRVYVELRRIGTNINQIARAVNAAAHSGDYPTKPGREALQAAERVREAMEVVGLVLERNGRYWGKYVDPDAAARAAEVHRIRETKKRRRPKRFTE